ncbi:D-2-hydroxyacid dehydrogenase [Skermanella aerolata]|uniref:D-2-hydroxyacid dehydrogenase n=1 Tax=Skermanella aerolata TaxID=393310 RepID=A0A512DYY5_9PROT|nr:FAD-binding oxidoreductase [Skermanella aerolata]GEO41649.1 D-2-hydroxyacid dehydrogenase [Skermanella aerolata]
MPETKKIDPALLDRLRAIVGPSGHIDDPADMEPYVAEWRGRYRGATPLVLRPATTQELSDVMRTCAEAGVPVVPQGGNTGLVGGSIPSADNSEVLISLSRMNKIREMDPLNYTVTVEAGCVLQTLQQAAADVDRLFPLSLGAEGTCQIGGNISANAGGTMTLRYGNTRDLVLGLEVVLPDGQIWNGMRRLRKNNTGYDLKHLFIGAEGTLGFITAAVLKLFPRPKQVETGFLAVRDPDAAIELLASLRSASGDSLSAFELMPRIALDFALKHVAGTIDPLSEPFPWYVLLELSTGTGGDAFRETIEAALGEAMEAGLVQDATLASSEAQAKQLWFIREAIVEAQKYEGGSIKHDISIPVSCVGSFIAQATEAVERTIPGARPVPFGHVGDGNIHFNVNQPVDADTEAYLAQWDKLNEVVHDIVLSMDGSISAEHGIGTFKREELQRVKSPVELDLMRRIKATLDPQGLMNPGKVL